MKYFLYTCLLLSLSCIPFLVQGQEDRANEFGLTREFTGGVGWHTRGFNVGVSYGWINKVQRTSMLHFDFREIKHPKEYKKTYDVLRVSGVTPRAFIYGKQNNFYVLAASYGQRHYLSDKGQKRGVAVALNYAIGPSLGILKPYYLDLIYRTDRGNIYIRSEAYSPENRDRFLDINSIDGDAGAGYGWNDISPRFGGNAKLSVVFDWGAWDIFAKSLEVGLMADIYFEKIPLLVETSAQKNTSLFFNLYANIYLGKRW